MQRAELDGADVDGSERSITPSGSIVCASPAASSTRVAATELGVVAGLVETRIAETCEPARRSRSAGSNEG